MVKTAGGPPLTGGQLRAARALVGMTANELAKDTLIEIKTIQRAEACNDEQVGMTAANTKRVIAALEKRGIVLIPSNGRGPGVCLAQPTQKKSARERPLK
jgi:hypothetical protein